VNQVSIGIALGALWFGCFLVSHLAWFHFRVVANRFQVLSRTLLLAAAGLCASWAAISLYGPSLVGVDGGGLPALICGLALIFALFIVYSPFYYTVAASLSIRTLIAILHSPRRELLLSRLTADGTFEAMVTHRLASMVASGNLTSDGERFRVTPKGHRIARFFNAVKHLWRLGAGG
jgi:hypothetical protein